MTYRILHVSDIHLERAFAGMGTHGEGARHRRQGLRDALCRAGKAAAESGCSAVTIGGDLYEHDRAGPETAQFLMDTFAAWQPMIVALAPGNHDALMPGSIYARTEWPPNVHLFSEPVLAPLELEDGLTLWGLAHVEPSWQGDPLASDCATAAGGVHLALFHGAEIGSRPAGKSVHGPFRAAAIRAGGFAGALSGHYHGRRMDVETGLLYPGTPEPLTFDDTGGRGPVIVEVAPSGDVSFHPLNINSWSAVSVGCDLEGAATLTSVMDRASATALAATAGLDPDRTVISVAVGGDVPCDLSLDVYSLETALRETTGMAAVRVRDMTRADLDAQTIAEERTARGAFARAALTAVREAEGDPAQAALLEDALRYGLQALGGVEVGLR